MSKPTLTNQVNYLSNATETWLEEYKYIFEYTDFDDIAYAYAKKTHNEQDLAFLTLFYTRCLFSLDTYHPWQIKAIDNKLNYISQSTSPLGTLIKNIRRLIKKSSTFSKVELEKQLFDLANEARDLGFKIPYHFSNFKQAIQSVAVARPTVKPNVNYSWLFPIGGVLSFGVYLYSIAPELLGGLIMLLILIIIFKDVLNNKTVQILAK